MPFWVGAERRELFPRGIVDGKRGVHDPELAQGGVAFFADHTDEHRGVNLEPASTDLDVLPRLRRGVLFDGVVVKVTVITLDEGAGLVRIRVDVAALEEDLWVVFRCRCGRIQRQA